MGSLAWASLLMAAGCALIVLEVFIPSSGLLGLLAALSLVAGILLAFQTGPMVGLGFLAGSLVGVPIVISMALRWWPHTPMGRRLLLTTPSGDAVLPDTEELRSLRALVGKLGYAKSEMLPAGAVLIEGRVINAQSEGLPIDSGQAVRVIEVRGNRVVVRSVKEVAATDVPLTDVVAAERVDEDLNRSIDVLGGDPFDDSTS